MNFDIQYIYTHATVPLFDPVPKKDNIPVNPKMNAPPFFLFTSDCVQISGTYSSLYGRISRLFSCSSGKKKVPASRIPLIAILSQLAKVMFFTPLLFVAQFQCGCAAETGGREFSDGERRENFGMSHRSFTKNCE